jgi:ribosomal protein S18 acetylase RimI-like enzyme
MQPSDRDCLVNITNATGFFRQEEVEVAREVLSEAAIKGEASGYRVRVATVGERPLGYVCFGPTPLTRSTWDIYWLAVDPQLQHQGLGTKLMRQAESEICQCSGRLVLVETSSQDLYQPTHRFYLSRGYREVSRIPDFYDVGDDKVTFAKALTGVWSGSTPP